MLYISFTDCITKLLDPNRTNRKVCPLCREEVHVTSDLEPIQEVVTSNLNMKREIRREKRRIFFYQRQHLIAKNEAEAKQKRIVEIRQTLKEKKNEAEMNERKMKQMKDRIESLEKLKVPVITID